MMWMVIEGEKLSEKEREYFKSISSLVVDSFDYSEKMAVECQGIFVKLPDKPDILFYQKLLKTRLSSETSLKPFLFWGRKHSFFDSPLWPTLNADVILSTWNTEDANKWKNLAVTSRSYNSDTFWGGFFEIIVRAVLFRDNTHIEFIRGDGAKGTVLLDRGKVVQCCTGRLSGKKALFDMLTWIEGTAKVRTGQMDIYVDVDSVIDKPLWDLLEEYYSQIKEIIFIFSMIESFDTAFSFIENNCALDDKGDPNYEGHKIICELIEDGNTLNQILTASPLNVLDTIAYIYRLLSFGDIVETGKERVDGTLSISEPLLVATMQPVEKLKVLIADDAPFFQRVLERVLLKDGRFEIIGMAKNGIECLELAAKLNPDVLSLDIEMPKLDGLGTLKRLMIKNPKPVVVLSAFTEETSRQTYEAFKLGAVDVIQKPSRFSIEEIEKQEKQIAERIFKAASVKLDAIRYVRKRRTAGIDNKVQAASRSRFLIFCYFGDGSFSLFLRVIAGLNGINPSLPIICVVPIKQTILDAIFCYMSRDFSLPFIKPDMESRLFLHLPSIYLIGSDVGGHFHVDGNIISFVPSRNESSSLEQLVDSLCEKCDPLFLAVSGRKSAAVPFVKAAALGYSVVYMNPSKCLFPNLGLELQKNATGFEVGDIEEIIRCIVEPEKFLNHIKTSLGKSVGSIVGKA